MQAISVPMEIDSTGFAPINSQWNPFQQQPQNPYQFQPYSQFPQPQYQPFTLPQPMVDLVICKCVLTAYKNKSAQRNEKNMYSIPHLQELCNIYNTTLGDPSKTIQMDVFFNALNTNNLIQCVATDTFVIN